MSSPVDPNDVLMTGENSFIRYSSDGGKTQSDRASHWRVLWCPAGAGHALFLKSTLTGGEVKIWSDNPPVARWLQKEIEALLFPAFADAKTPVAPAGHQSTRQWLARSVWILPLSGLKRMNEFSPVIMTLLGSTGDGPTGELMGGSSGFTG